jgi:diketogulonate reductase-like aldo/keto reductase
VTTKLAAECKNFETARERIDRSLRALGLDHIDLMLIHSPQPWAKFRAGEHFFAGNLEAWRALEEAHAAGKLRAIGVSNFEAVDLDNLLEHGSVAPMVNQVLAHVGNTPFDLIDYSRSKGILRDNAAVDFVISDADMDILKAAASHMDYGEASAFPVFGKKRQV